MLERIAKDMREAADKLDYWIKYAFTQEREAGRPAAKRRPRRKRGG